MRVCVGGREIREREGEKAKETESEKGEAAAAEEEYEQTALSSSEHSWWVGKWFVLITLES